jgi:hypothetical protein
MQGPRRVQLPNARISAFDRAPGRLMGPGPAAGKQGAPGTVENYIGDPFQVASVPDYVEVFRRSVAGYSKGSIFVGAVVVMGATTAALVPRPQLLANVQIVGICAGLEEVLAYGMPGPVAATNAGFPPSYNDMSAPLIYTTWEDADGFDYIVVRAKGEGVGALAFNGSLATGDSVLVNVSGKLWR